MRDADRVVEEGRAEAEWKVRGALKYEWRVGGNGEGDGISENGEREGVGREGGEGSSSSGGSSGASSIPSSTFSSTPSSPQGACGRWERFSGEAMCRVVAGRNTMIVGDSLNLQLAHALRYNVRVGAEDPGERVRRGRISVLCRRVRDASYSPWLSLQRCWTAVLCGDVEGRGDGGDVVGQSESSDSSSEEGSPPSPARPSLAFNLSFVRDDYLLSPAWRNQWLTKRVHGSWVDDLRRENVSILIVNRGAHFTPHESFAWEVSGQLAWLREQFPDLLIVVRGTPAGHRGCMRYDRPLEKKFGKDDSSDSDKGDGIFKHVDKYNWDKFARQNEVARKVAEAVGAVYMDVESMTELRPDSHRGAKDCLHYCHPASKPVAVVSGTAIVMAAEEELRPVEENKDVPEAGEATEEIKAVDGASEEGQEDDGSEDFNKLIPADDSDSDSSDSEATAQDQAEKKSALQAAREQKRADAAAERKERRALKDLLRRPWGNFRLQGEEGVSVSPFSTPSPTSLFQRPSRNTVGKVPLEWYKEEGHIGYDREGKRIMKHKGRASKGDKLDEFLAHTDDPDAWKVVYDEYNDEEIRLTEEDIDMIRRIREGRTPHANVNPYEPYLDWFDWDEKWDPLNAQPEPKRRFTPSKHEAKQVRQARGHAVPFHTSLDSPFHFPLLSSPHAQIVRLVRGLRKGTIKTLAQREKERKQRESEGQQQAVYLMWGDDLKAIASQSDKTKNVNGLSFVPAPKPKLPGHEESYNPPVEYIPTEEEVAEKMMQAEYEGTSDSLFVPKQYKSLRSVPAYPRFIRERFERCLDLYLCPRVKKNRIMIDPDALLPKLPKRKDLRPFPHSLSLRYLGHQATVRSLSLHPSGQWLASGSDDGTVRVWEVDTTRCRRVIHLPMAVKHVAWSPAASRPILAITS
ncbi:unnamed protein product, partial [Closterium sp. Yama58-4]